MEKPSITRINVISESVYTVKGHGVHTAFTETVAGLVGAGMDVRTNTLRQAEVTHVHTVGPYALFQVLFGRGAKVVSAHVMPDSLVGSFIGAKLWYGLAAAYLRWFYNRPDVVLAVSAEVVDELTRLGVKRPVELAPNTIDTQAFRSDSAMKTAARVQLGIAPDVFMVVGNGQVQPRKRIDTFLAMADAVPEAQFVWVGGMPFGRLAADSAHMAALMNAPRTNVRFAGLVEREDVVEYYRAADLFCLPSEQETFGIVVVEGAAAGLPVLLRDLAQYRATFAPDYAAAADDAEFAAQVRRFMADPDYAAGLRERSAHLASHYDAVAGTRRLLEAYGRAVEIHGRR